MYNQEDETNYMILIHSQIPIYGKLAMNMNLPLLYMCSCGVDVICKVFTHQPH